MNPIRLAEKPATFHEPWQPRGGRVEGRGVDLVHFLVQN